MLYGSDGLPIYKDKQNKRIICVKCFSGDIESISKFNGIPYFAKFSSLSPEGKRDVLRKRAKEHSKAEKEKRMEIDKMFKQKLKGK